MSEKFLITPADGDIDEDEGMTRLELLEMLAVDLGYLQLPDGAWQPPEEQSRRRRTKV